MKTSHWFKSSRVPVSVARTLGAVALASLVAVALHATWPGTVPLAPGGVVVPGVTSLPPMWTNVASQTVQAIPASKDYEVIFSSNVYRESGGTLDFDYSVINLPLSTDSISRLTVGGFGPFHPSVGQSSLCPAGRNPASADRDNNGNIVGINFGPSASPSTGKIVPGTCGTVLISTDATNFAVGNVSLIDGGATMVPSLVPTSSTTPVYRYDFYFKSSGFPFSFLSNGFVRDWSPASVPMPGFNGFTSWPALVPCDLTSNSSGELDCRGSYTGLDGNQVNGIFYFVFNYGGYPRQLGSFTGSGYVRLGSSVFPLQDGKITQVSP